ncbi:WXG100 family type VII secretion target [Amycolatopsis suaedae]|uniref:WXG100 family type VII secretion target n=1 Tax=Amycolatopsis suaedae TaxID=2510978 RepID=A0A4Q7J3H6_9PSEU|nr:WXG100 family type VII secretion target [Amycolatopsis suaedae]RZQ62040.1 WXG100 family type VII secretion target [Amycolatopsis suaedae]
MTGHQVATEALTAHGSGSKETADHFASLASLLEQARVSDECFGPIGEVLAFKYFENLEECQGLATQAKAFLDEMEQKTGAAAKAYLGNEEATTDGIKKLGDFEALNSAGDGQRKGYVEQHGGYGSSILSNIGDIKRASSPPDIAIAAVNARMEQLQLVTSPGQSFLDNGLGFLIGIVISPLVEFVLEPAIGDPEQMRSTAKGWEQVAKWLEETGQHESKRAAATAEAWKGDAGDAFRTQMTEFGDGTAAFANDIRNVQRILEIAADLFDAFVEIVIDIIQELVMGLIIEWLAALAASWITAGASMAAAGVTTTAHVSGTAARLAMKVKLLLGKLKPLIDQLEDVLRMVRTGPLKQVVQRTEAMRDGNWFQKKLVMQLDNNPIAKIVTKADPVTGASKTGNKFAGRMGINEGSEALSANLAEAGLRAAGMSGTTDVGRAAFRGTMENAPGLAMEQGIKYGYDKAADPSSEEERRQATDKGFTVE